MMRVKLSSILIALLLLPPLFWPRYIWSSALIIKRSDEVEFLQHDTEPSDPSKSYYTLPLDPGSYHAKINQRRKSEKRRKKRRRKQSGLLGSFSSNQKSKVNKNKLRYTFLKQKSSRDCESEPSPKISAFTFMNFALSAATLAANLVSNTNSNNNNNNNIQVCTRKKIVGKETRV